MPTTLRHISRSLLFMALAMNAFLSSTRLCAGPVRNEGDMSHGSPANALTGIGEWPLNASIADHSGTASFPRLRDHRASLSASPPAIICPADITVSSSIGSCGAIVPFQPPLPSVSGTTAIVQIAGPLSGSLFLIGSTTVSFQASYSDGSSSFCSFIVTVLDSEVPSITCPPNIGERTATGTCTALVHYPDPSFTPSCPGTVLTRIAGPASGSLFSVGSTTVTYRLTTSSGASTTCSFDVSVFATGIPTFQGCEDIVTTVSPSACSASVDHSPPSLQGTCASCSGTVVPPNSIELGNFEGRSYTLVNTPTFWAQAHQQATQAGGRLAIVRNAAMNSWLRSAVDNANPSLSGSARYFWIGLNDLETEGEYRWTNGEVSSYFNWRAGEPNNYSGNEDHVEVRDDGGWNDESRSILRRFVIEKDSLCGTPFLVSALPSGSAFPIGVSTVVYAAYDAAGNRGECSFTVTVLDPSSCGCGLPQPGAPCDDGDATTGNDIIGSDCNCSGLLLDCAGAPGGTAYVDDCNTCVGGTTGQTACVPDCHNDFGGTAYLDNCNTCVGGNTGQQACVADCYGEFGGTAYIDNCDICVGGNTGQTACVADCHNDFGGTAYLDNCNTCVGGNTGQQACVADCYGEFGGTAVLDNCDTCVGGNTGLTACVADCNGEFGGTSYIDNCDSCVGGDTGQAACVADCNGDFGGTAYLDNCNTCVDGNTSLTACVADCNGEFGGTAVLDNCDTCVSGNTGLTACVADCNGEFGGTSYLDNCNTCVGGNTGQAACVADCNGDFGGTAMLDNCDTCVGGNTGLTACVADCIGEFGGNNTAGTACDDGDPSTANDTWSFDCQCLGTPVECSSDAGEDRSICGTRTEMEAIGVGSWIVEPGVSASSATDPNANVEVPRPGSYRFIWVVEEPNCSARDTVTMEFMDDGSTLWVDAGPDQRLELSTSTFLEGHTEEGSNIMWSVISGPGRVQSPNELGTVVEGLGIGLNVLTLGSSLNSCATVIDTLRIEVLELFIPEGFSPNGDGVNDRYEITGLRAFPNSELTVFNRWGQEVHRNAAYANEWDGRLQNGSELPNETYFYVLNLSNGASYKGHIILRR